MTTRAVPSALIYAGVSLGCSRTTTKLLTVRFVVKRKDIRRVLFRDAIVCRATLFWGRSRRIARVEVPSDQFLSARLRDFAHEVVVAAKRRSREGGRDAEDALESLFDTAHLGVYVIGRKGGQILVRPCVGADHVSLAVNEFDPLDVFCGIDASIWDNGV
jgi:hypothetical protein